MPGAVKPAMNGASTGSGNPWKANIDDIIVIEDFNVRDKDEDYYAKVREIADSIKVNGYIPASKFWFTSPRWTTRM